MLFCRTGAVLVAFIVAHLGRATAHPGYAPPAKGSAGNGPTPTAACTATPAYSFGDSFSYKAMTTLRYATPLKSPAVYTPYASPYSAVSKLIPGTQVFTTWKYEEDSKATDTNDPYGQAAYRSLWSNTTFESKVPFTTTVEPTPLPSSELVFPPPLYEPCDNADSCVDCYKLGPEFVWGVASSAWQIEGGLQEEGRGPSILDAIGTPKQPGADANVADMQYYLYKQDIVRIASLGIPYYSFSISWSRVLPFGFAHTPINSQAIKHYSDLIDFCLEQGVTPIVTLTHVDSPQVFQGERGPIGYSSTGYNHPKFVESFEYYARVMMTRFADRVPYWVTFNEPNINTDYFLGYYNVLMSNAKVWHFYHEELKGTGQVALKFANNLAFPRDISSPSDVQAAYRYNDWLVGLLGNPLFLGETWPSVVTDTAGTQNGSLGLPDLSEKDLDYIHGTCDFFAIDCYTSIFASDPSNGFEACAANTEDPLWPQCVNQTNVAEDGWLIGNPSFAYAYTAPRYFRESMKYYNNVFKPKGGILLAEFGFNPSYEANLTLDHQLFDLQRTYYYRSYLTEMLKLIYEDGVKIIGALGWSMMDNNEFGSYEQHYGMQAVNRTTMVRSFKRSMFDFVDFFHKHVGR